MIIRVELDSEPGGFENKIVAQAHIGGHWYTLNSADWERMSIGEIKDFCTYWQEASQKEGVEFQISLDIFPND